MQSERESYTRGRRRGGLPALALWAHCNLVNSYRVECLPASLLQAQRDSLAPTPSSCSLSSAVTSVRPIPPPSLPPPPSCSTLTPSSLLSLVPLLRLQSRRASTATPTGLAAPATSRPRATTSEEDCPRRGREGKVGFLYLSRVLPSPAERACAYVHVFLPSLCKRTAVLQARGPAKETEVSVCGTLVRLARLAACYIRMQPAEESAEEAPLVGLE